MRTWSLLVAFALLFVAVFGVEEECQASVEELQAAKETIAKHEKELSRAKSLEKKVEELEKELASLKKQDKDNIESLKKQLKEEKKKHDAEVARLKKLSSIVQQPLYLIAFERGMERYDEFQQRWSIFYEKDLEPLVKKAKQEASVKFEPVMKKVSEHLERVRPQFEMHVSPHLEKARAVVGQAHADATKRFEAFSREFSVHFAVFRGQCVTNLKRQKTFPSLATMAEDVIDASFFLVVAILVMLLAPTVLRVVLALVKSVFYYGFCCCCCCGTRRKAKQ